LSNQRCLKKFVIPFLNVSCSVGRNVFDSITQTSDAPFSPNSVCRSLRLLR
jgi:hypothetical protein